MHLFLGLPLALCALSLVSPAPIREPGKEMYNPEFLDAAENGHSLISKILDEIPTVYKSWIHTESLPLDSIDKLQYLKKDLSLPTAPLTHSGELTRAARLSQIAEGLRLHRTVLEVLSKFVRAKSARLDGLLHDIRDLLLQVHKMQSLTSSASTSETPALSKSQLEADLAPRLKDEYLSQVAANLAMYELKMFSHEVSRSLKSMISEESDSQTTLGWN